MIFSRLVNENSGRKYFTYASRFAEPLMEKGIVAMGAELGTKSKPPLSGFPSMHIFPQARARSARQLCIPRQQPEYMAGFRMFLVARCCSMCSEVPQMEHQ